VETNGNFISSFFHLCRTSGNKWQKLETDSFSRMTQPAAAPDGRGRPFQSRLIPHVQRIRAWRRGGKTWREIAQILTEQGCKTSPSSAYKFMARFRRRPYASEAEPEERISPAIRHITFQPLERKLPERETANSSIADPDEMVTAAEEAARKKNKPVVFKPVKPKHPL
jgi:hypothetical protein